MLAKILFGRKIPTSGVTSNSSTSAKTDKEVPSATAQTNAKTDTTQQTDKAAFNPKMAQVQKQKH